MYERRLSYSQEKLLSSYFIIIDAVVVCVCTCVQVHVCTWCVSGCMFMPQCVQRTEDDFVE